MRNGALPSKSAAHAMRGSPTSSDSPPRRSGSRLPSQVARRCETKPPPHTCNT